ncbi:MAG: radical SAM protein [Candidatus Bathyarchaeota archaeon]|nr:radical SAM protein [Candidatus Bathyarchaeota archaeon]MDW8040490.1 radical SAM protein [Nitrososphaerota archaeon]
MSLLVRFDPWHSSLCTCPPKLTFNPYTGCDHRCVYCYASSYVPRFFECRPKKDLLLRLRREAIKLKGELISISNSSDPYPTVEAEAGLTRRCLQILAECNCQIQIITKSNIVLRDMDLLKRASSMVALTITTDDAETAKALEPYAPPPEERLKTAERLAAEGIPVVIRIDPIIPYVNENPEFLVRAAAEIGVRHITASTYKVKMDNWQRLSLAMPKIAEKLKPLYFEKGEKMARYLYLPKGLRIRLLENLAKLAKKYGLKFATCREGLKGLNTATCDGSWLIKGRS